MSEPRHRVLRQLLSGLGRPTPEPAAAHLSDAVLGDLAAGRTARDAAQQQRAHLDGCLACLKRFTALQAALTTRSDVQPAARTPTTTQLAAAVNQAIQDVRGASAAFGGHVALGTEAQHTAVAWRAMPATSLAFMMRIPEPSVEETDPLLARLDALAAETNQQLKEIWTLRALVKKLRRLRRQVRKSDLPASRRAELRAALSEAEELLLVSLTGPRQ